MILTNAYTQNTPSNNKEIQQQQNHTDNPITSL